MPGKSILSQLTSPYNRMYQTGGTVGPTKYTGVTQAQPQQPADDTTWGGDFTWGGGDFVSGGGGALDWTQENFDAGAAASGGDTRDPDWTFDSPFGPQGSTTWEEEWGHLWGSSNPGSFDYTDPGTWPPGWQPGDEIPGWSEWFTGGSGGDFGDEAYVGPGSTGENAGGPPWWDVEGGGVGAGGVFGDAFNFDSWFDDMTYEDLGAGFGGGSFWDIMEDLGYPMPDWMQDDFVPGSAPLPAMGALGMETTEGYEPGRFDANLVRRKPVVAPQIQNVNFDQASLEQDILKQLGSPSSQRGGQDEQSQIVDAVLNELRL